MHSSGNRRNNKKKRRKQHTKRNCDETSGGGARRRKFEGRKRQSDKNKITLETKENQVEGWRSGLMSIHLLRFLCKFSPSIVRHQQRDLIPFHPHFTSRQPHPHCFARSSDAGQVDGNLIIIFDAVRRFISGPMFGYTAG